MQTKQSNPPEDILDIRHEEFVSNFEQIDWPRRLIEQTEARFAEDPFLSGYRYAD